MEDKDPKDDELNQEGQDDINDADDSFGLPDLDYKPLEEADDTEEEEIVIEEEITETEYYTEETEEEGDFNSEDSEEEQAEPVRRYSSYRDNDESSMAPKIIVAVLAVIVIALGIWYFGFYDSGADEKAKIEAAEAQRQTQIKLEEAAAARRLQEQEDAAVVEEVIDEVVAESTEIPERGGITTISEPTSRYYVVIGSFIDVDLATDLGKELAAKGVSTKLISPFSKKRLFRLCVADYGTFGDASAGADNLKAEYGENLWVLKY